MRRSEKPGGKWARLGPALPRAVAGWPGRCWCWNSKETPDLGVGKAGPGVAVVSLRGSGVLEGAWCPLGGQWWAWVAVVPLRGNGALGGAMMGLGGSGDLEGQWCPRGGSGGLGGNGWPGVAMVSLGGQ